MKNEIKTLRVKDIQSSSCFSHLICDTINEKQLNPVGIPGGVLLLENHKPKNRKRKGFNPDLEITDYSILEVYLFLHIHSYHGRLSYKNVKSFVSHFKYDSMVRRLERKGLIRYDHGWVIVSKREVLGKRWNRKYDIDKLEMLSWGAFKDKLFSRLVSTYLYRQNWMIWAKGGIKGIKAYRSETAAERQSYKRQYRRLRRDGISTEVRPIQFTVRAFGSWLGLDYRRVSERLQSLRDKGILVYRSIKKKLTTIIPDYVRGIMKEYFYTYKGKTVIHYGSLVYFKDDKLFNRNYLDEYKALVNDCPEILRGCII